jgi:hypothetical protein
VSKLTTPSLHLAAQPVYLVASAVNNLIRSLPAGTAYFIGIVLITMMTGQLIHHQGSLARASLPYVVHLRWGWHRVERAMARGQFSLDALFDRALAWCLAHLPVEPVVIGCERRQMQAIDSSTIARLRAGAGLALAGKAYCHRARRAVRANIVGVWTSVVLVRGSRLGLVRRTRFGATCEQAVGRLFADLPASPEKRLFAVDAGIATQEQFVAATDQDALVGRLRRNVKLRRAAPPRKLRRRGRPRRHGPVLHPGGKHPEGRPEEDFTQTLEGRQVRLRRWRNLHFESAPGTVIEVVRVDDPAYPRPLLIATTARELSTEEIRQAYGHRWPVETNFYVAQGTCAMEKPRAWTEQSVSRRISLALLTGAVLKAIAAACEPLRMGPWDRRAVGSAGRLANHLDIHASNFAALALEGVAPRNYRKIEEAIHRNDLQQSIAA